jgi:hypothetical protein
MFLAPRAPARRLSAGGVLRDEGASQHRPLGQEGSNNLTKGGRQSYVQSST